jgi:hypothetical protein
MKAPKVTVRLEQVVQKCGRPNPLTLWQNPARNRAFQTAVHEDRVLTLKQETVGTKKDFGLVGFHKEPHVSFWVFPKSLRPFEGKKIIGIHYNLLNDAPVGPPTTGRITKPKSRQRPAANEKTGPKLRRFRIVVRHLATVDAPLEIEAPNRKAAIELALARTERVDFSQGNQTRKALKVNRLR